MTPRNGKKARRERDESYKDTLYRLQVELVKLQRHVIAEQLPVLLLFEGRDAAGKDGTIKRVTEHMSPRETRVFAPGRPSDRDVGSWYFARFAPHLPTAGEIALFNRSWYNRAGVERVMDYCSDEQVERFLRQVPTFERLLVEAGVVLVKLYLDISRAEQAQRLEARRQDPLKQWKISPVDERALELWDDYTGARNEMLRRTHTDSAPWTIVRADDKRATRLEAIRWILSRIAYPKRDEALLRPDPERIFPFEQKALGGGRLAG